MHNTRSAPVFHHFISRTICAIGLYLAAALILGCAQKQQYTSQDLTILPCEQKANDFFFPLEYDEDGHYVYKDQAPAIEDALQRAERVYVFVHGWNKNPELAERDYQDLICRFYTHSKRAEAEAKQSIIIGVFWPSADFPPLLNFWRMKSRADGLALTGFQNLISLLASASVESNHRYDLVLIGHSFGGRIILNGLAHYTADLTPKKHRFLRHLNQLQLVLLTTAIGEYALLPFFGRLEVATEDPLEYKRDWDSEAFLQEMMKQYGRKFKHKELLVDFVHLHLRWNPTLVELSGVTDFRIYNIFSTHDYANRLLYPMGSFTERGQPACAIGACGVSQWPHQASVTPAGSLGSSMSLTESNLWNVDASTIIFSHTDIYKGRIANLIWELIALPRPVFSDNKVAGIPGNAGIYKRGSQQLQYAMKEIHRFRQMGEVGLKAVDELSNLAFGVNESLRKGDWAEAEKGIREIARQEHFYPGWHIQADLGLIEKGLLWDSSRVRAEGTPLNVLTIHLLLAYVLLKQGKCDEIGNEARIGTSGVTQRYWYKEGWLSSLDFLPDNFRTGRTRLLNCHE